MARIRTIKPEAFESEDLASVSVTAERTFFGLLTLADDSGRFRDHPAIIAGRLWALRPEHTATHVAADLEQLTEAGLICRYTGCDGRTYLHIVTWERHQRIDRPSASRLPRCPHHQAAHRCGGCGTDPCPRSVPVTPLVTSSTASPDARHLLSEDSSSPRRVLSQADSPGPSPSDGSAAVTVEPDTPASRTADHRPVPSASDRFGTAGEQGFTEDSPKARRGVGEGSESGSRILDPGSVPSGRTAPAPDTVPESVSAKGLLAEYVSGCAHRPPEDTLGHLGRQVRKLLDEGFGTETVRLALERMRAKGLHHPSVLPSVVHEVLNAAPSSAASGAGPWASDKPAYTPWTNPTDTSVYQEAL
ncbi:hypothetical protein [Streptomyces sp. URMC 125]|uniref:hypothetical protein n=1 Tax=Streptomyces sp. URMC 125 TaxID=3423419 RepID=UPI003F1A5652